MKIGILGGTFNPIHLAHLNIAAAVRDRFTLDRIIFIPAAIPPHKELDGAIDYADRRAMVALAIAGEPAFTVSDIEERRGGWSYSVYTLAELQALHPDDELYFIIGSDSFLEIASWYRACGNLHPQQHCRGGTAPGAAGRPARCASCCHAAESSAMIPLKCA